MESLSAKASIIWLMGQYFRSFPTISQDVLRTLTQSFVNEAEEVKLQILNFAAKMHAANIANENTERTAGLISQLLTLASFDLSYTVRQKARQTKFLICSDTTGKEDETTKTRSRITSLLLTQNLKSSQVPGLAPAEKESLGGEHISSRFHLHSVSFMVNKLMFYSIIERIECERVLYIAR